MRRWRGEGLSAMWTEVNRGLRSTATDGVRGPGGNWQAAVNDRHHSLASLGGRRHIVTPTLPRPLAQSDLQQTAR